MKILEPRKNYFFAKSTLSIGVLLGSLAINPGISNAEVTPIDSEVNPTWCVYKDTYTKSNKTFIKERFVEALTPWAKATSYTWSDTTTSTATVTGTLSAKVYDITKSIGVSYSTSKSYSVAQTIPVGNSSRDNRLVLKADMNRYNVVRKYGDPCVPGNMKSQTGYLYSPTNSHYLRVEYK